jgi:hypothetical protein
MASCGLLPQTVDEGFLACRMAAGGGPQLHEPEEDVAPYLDGLRIFLACCARAEMLELARICRQGGACRYNLLNPLITHVVVRELVLPMHAGWMELQHAILILLSQVECDVLESSCMATESSRAACDVPSRAAAC